MKVSNIARLLQVALVGACTGLVHAEDADSKRSAVMRIIETNGPEFLTQDGELVADWKARLAARKRVAPLEWIPSDRAAMEGEVLDAITFWDDVSRYNLVLHEDGAVLVDIRAQTVTNSFAFNVGPVPTVKDPDKVFIAALGAMARRNRNSGTFDMEVGELTSETAMDALERSDAAAVFLNSGTVVALFFVDSEVNAILLFSPQDHSGVEDGGTREALTPQDEHDMACTVLFEECTLRRNVQACAFWLQLCDTT